MLFSIVLSLVLSIACSTNDQPPQSSGDQSISQASSSASSSSSSSGEKASSNASSQAQSSSSSGSKPQKPPCIPTCAVPNPKNCRVDSKYICEGGFILSKKGGKCIRIEDCPQNLGCNGDENAVVMSCPPPCPSTCDSPEQIPCKRACLAVGCACKPGFILSDKGCIRPDCCPNGYPCPKNERFVNCKIPCPTNYCPEDDNPWTIICDPVYPCPSGCVCDYNYKRKSVSEPQCIPAETCPPVKCTRQNEVWAECPECLAEDCSDVDNQPTTCNTLIRKCDPRCICDEGFFRNQDKLCVPPEDCPQ